MRMRRSVLGSLISALPLLASCGGGSSASSPPATPSPPPPPPPPPAAISIASERVFDAVSMTAPVALLQAPGAAGYWHLVEQGGAVRRFPNDPDATDADVTLFANLQSRIVNGGERGLLGLAFHPDFGNGNYTVFVSYTRENGGLESVISRFASIDMGQTLDTSVEDILLTIPQDFGNHNGGHLAFGPDGLLYAGIGDGGSGGDPFDRAQDTSNLLGTILRIDIDSAMPYSIPAGNPFAANAANPCPQGFGGADCPEIFAYGLRNPWRFSFDSVAGDLWAGDVGQGAWEEIDRVTAGGNYGWDDREGAHCFEPATGCIMNSIDPVTEYDHTVGQSVTGGYVYRGTAIAELAGHYVYGDFVSGRVWAIAADAQQGEAGELLLDTTLSIASFAEGVDRELYVVDYAGGVHKLVHAP